MKNFINRKRNVWAVGLIIILATGCDLGLQEEWEYEKEPIGNVEIDMTVYEWLQMINQDTTYNINDTTAEFSYLLEAIERTGMQEEFNTPDDKRTFFLLRNSAWDGGGQILAHVAGSADYPLDSIETDRLANVLKYHILPDDAIDQSNIPKSDAFFYYQTLIPGDTGIMELNRRLWNSQIRINTKIDRIGTPDTDSNMPSSAKGGTVALHNYRFTNGFGHQINGYVRYQPF